MKQTSAHTQPPGDVIGHSSERVTKTEVAVKRSPTVLVHRTTAVRMTKSLELWIRRAVVIDGGGDAGRDETE